MKPITEDGVYRSLERQDAHYRKESRERDTDGKSFRERREVICERIEREKVK